MLSSKEVLTLAGIPGPVLTAYVETGERSSPNAGPAAVTWIRQKAKSVAGTLPTQDQEAFRHQVERVEEFLRERNVREDSVVILAGPSTWKFVPLRVKAQNELHWGRPAVLELLSLTTESKPCCIVAVDRTGARFFIHELGEMKELGEKKFKAEFSQWKKKESSHMARKRTRMPHGPQRDAFKKRIDAQYKRFCRDVAERALALCKSAQADSIFLVGSKRLTEPIESHFPAELRGKVALFSEDLARIPAAKMQARLASQIGKWNDGHQMNRVNAMLDGEHAAIAEFDEALAQLQSGRIRTLVLAEGFDSIVRQCAKCGLASRAADRICSACGGERRMAVFTEILPELLLKYETDIEVVRGEAAKKLIAAGGMGGWLRQPK